MPNPNPFGQPPPVWHAPPGMPGLPKKLAVSKCSVCRTTHEHAGPYLCLNCGRIICFRMAYTEANSHEVIAHHDGTCGPAVRQESRPFSFIRLRKTLYRKPIKKTEIPLPDFRYEFREIEG